MSVARTDPIANKFLKSGILEELIKKPKFIGAYCQCRKSMSHTQHLTSSAAWFSILFMVLTSLPFMRKRLHGLFRICHLIGLCRVVPDSPQA